MKEVSTKVMIDFWNLEGEHKQIFEQTKGDLGLHGIELKKGEVGFYDTYHCHCYNEDDPDLLGAFQVINNDGNAFSIRIYDQETYDQMCKIFPHDVHELIQRHSPTPFPFH